jgi:aminoglycoside phosphotransferase (APT) family kinase protein
LAAIVDWEMCTIGDPKLDLAWALRDWPAEGAPGGGSGPVRGGIDLTGMPARDQLLKHYAQVSHRQVDDFDYYLILARWKLAIVLEQGFQRAGDDPTLQGFGPLVLELMLQAAELAETTSYSNT